MFHRKKGQKQNGTKNTNMKSVNTANEKSSICLDFSCVGIARPSMNSANLLGSTAGQLIDLPTESSGFWSGSALNNVTSNTQESTADRQSVANGADDDVQRLVISAQQRLADINAIVNRDVGLPDHGGIRRVVVRQKRTPSGLRMRRNSFENKNANPDSLALNGFGCTTGDILR